MEVGPKVASCLVLRLSVAIKIKCHNRWKWRIWALLPVRVIRVIWFLQLPDPTLILLDSSLELVIFLFKSFNLQLINKIYSEYFWGSLGTFLDTAKTEIEYTRVCIIWHEWTYSEFFLRILAILSLQSAIHSSTNRSALTEVVPSSFCCFLYLASTFTLRRIAKLYCIWLLNSELARQLEWT